MNTIDPNFVHELCLKDCTWVVIAKKCEVSISTLERWRKKTGFVHPLQRISQQQLDEIVLNYSNEHPTRGEALLKGELRALQAKVRRSDLRSTVERVDPGGRERRKYKKLKRRVYSTPGPYCSI